VEQYLRSRGFDDLADVLAANARGESVAPQAMVDLIDGVLDSEALEELDLVAAGDLAWRRLDGPTRSRTVAKVGSAWRLRVPSTGDQEVDRSGMISVIAPVSVRSTHLDMIYGYAVALALAEPSVRTKVLLTAEYSWGRWHQGSSDSLREELLEPLVQLCDVTAGGKAASERIDLVLAPRGEEFAANIGSRVIRFEGIAPWNVSRIYGRWVHDRATVLTAVFASAIGQVGDSDGTLVLNPALDNPAEGLFLFEPPIPGRDFSRILRPESEDPRILTVYSGGRIDRFLENANPEWWTAMSRILRSNPDATWSFVGCENPDACRHAILRELAASEAARVEVHPFTSDLEAAITGGTILVALPGVAGGGGLAVQVVQGGIPVGVLRDAGSDISNLLPSADQPREIEALSAQVEAWLRSPEARLSAQSIQAEHVRANSDLLTKGRYLLEVFTRVGHERQPLEVSG
jgi:hypothetical protein